MAQTGITHHSQTAARLHTASYLDSVRQRTEQQLISNVTDTKDNSLSQTTMNLDSGPLTYTKTLHIRIA